MPFILGYLFVSYGPRHVVDATQLPAAAQQMRRLKTIADQRGAQRGASLKIPRWDYRNHLYKSWELVGPYLHTGCQSGCASNLMLSRIRDMQDRIGC